MAHAWPMGWDGEGTHNIFSFQIWKVMNELDGVKIFFLSNLSRHTKAVNIVRFAPNGMDL